MISFSIFISYIFLSSILFHLISYNLHSLSFYVIHHFIALISQSASNLIGFACSIIIAILFFGTLVLRVLSLGQAALKMMVLCLCWKILVIQPLFLVFRVLVLSFCHYLCKTSDWLHPCSVLILKLLLNWITV